LHDARRPWVDVQHTERVATIQHDRAFHRRLDDEAPGDAELAVEEVGARSKDHMADGCIGKCTVQASDGAHRHDRSRRR